MKANMRGIVFRRYGNPTKVMKLETDIDRPQPGSGEVLIKVNSSSINAADVHMVLADYVIIRILMGFFKPSKSRRILGMDVAGTIENVGENVSRFRVGDVVAADIRNKLGGGFAEYVIVNEDRLVKIPSGVSFE